MTFTGSCLVHIASLASLPALTVVLIYLTTVSVVSGMGVRHVLQRLKPAQEQWHLEYRLMLKLLQHASYLQVCRTEKPGSLSNAEHGLLVSDHILS